VGYLHQQKSRREEEEVAHIAESALEASLLSSRPDAPPAEPTHNTSRPAEPQVELNPELSLLSQA
jgi:hypothetical protein